jgi:dTDP-4-dehydrorhamnose reductase
MRILVIGGSGLVGSNVVTLADAGAADVYATYRETAVDHAGIELDKTDEERTATIVSEVNPDLIVDTAAFHAVDECETERDRAWSVNAAGTRNVAVAANATDAHLVYLSTDYVFPGNSREAPYVEADSVSPVNYYAETKYAAEQAAKIANKATILRPSVIYGLASGNFVTWALGELAADNELTIVEDQISTPTYAPDIAEACLRVYRRGLTGLYHATGPQSINRYEFTKLLAEVYGFDVELVKPISTEEFGQEAPRPENSSLDSSRLYESISYEFETPREAFSEMRDRSRPNGLES